MEGPIAPRSLTLVIPTRCPFWHRLGIFLALLGRTSAASDPPPPPPAPPCTVEMLKQRPAGDKSWPIACSNTTLGTTDEELDLSGAHLSYGDFEGATFTGAGAIKLNGAGLAHADLSDSRLTAGLSKGKALIDFTAANLTSADLSGSKITATGSYSGDATIDFTEADLTNADLSGSEITADTVVSLNIPGQ